MKLKIQKFNPSTDSEPYYVEGEVEYHKNITALDAVYLFHANNGPVNFDYSCGGRICGRCSVMVDGAPALLCLKVLDDSSHTIEPLKGFPIIRDLVVDKSSFEEVMANIANRIMLEPVTKETVTPEGFVHDVEVEDMLVYGDQCCRCGMCQVVCPALQVNPEAYAGPAQLYAIGYRHLDWHDQGNRVAQAVGAGLYHCILCGQCTEVCGYNIPHVKMRELIRNEAVELGLVPSYAE